MPLTPTQTRKLIVHLGLTPRQDLGQNFLIDANIVDKSIQLAEIQAGDTVVEIGPGLGTLTRVLLSVGATVYAVEIDEILYRFCKEALLKRFPHQIFLKRADAVKYPLAGFNHELNRSFKVVANLPYAISTPWLDAVLTGSLLPARMVLMLQKETADRFTAQPGTKNFGAITIFLQSSYLAKTAHRVSHHCFYPKPDVDSVLLYLELKKDTLQFANATKSIIRSIFNYRRKQIGTICRRNKALYPWLEYLEAAEVDLKTRPEAIPLQQWQALPKFSENSEAAVGADDPIV